MVWRPLNTSKTDLQETHKTHARRVLLDFLRPMVGALSCRIKLLRKTKHNKETKNKKTQGWVELKLCSIPGKVDGF